MRWYAILFWLWLFASVAILVVRRTSRSSSTAGASESEPVDPVNRRWAPPPPDPDADSPPVSARPPDHEAPVPESSAAVATADDEPFDDWLEVHPTLPELLAGITLPHELVPLTQFAPSAGIETHVVVATTSAPAEVVDAGLTDELERLGYTVSPSGEHTRIADGPRGSLTIEIHPDGATVLDGGALRFPTASSGMVVVELRTE